ncbi:asparaginase [bacterium LRH843]|nr:asparaginase [bacterium LRH843]
MKKILVLHTGGTIAMQEDEHGAVRTSAVNPLYSTTQSVASIATIIADDYLNIPSPHMTPTLMIGLANHIRERILSDGFDGVVITHGTDTLEETAYLLDLLLNVEIPVIVTGAMRSSNELSADGPHNLITSIRVAACDDARNMGVLVVFNDEIHAAKTVTKTHTSNVDTFKSPQFGPVGIVSKQTIFIERTPKNRESYDVRQLSKKVALLKSYAGMDREIVDAIANAKIDGLVIEAFGQGNVPPAIVPTLTQLIEDNIPVVLVSRCQNGIVQATYAYEGGGKALKDIGVIFTDGLNGQKARLKLMVLLEKKYSRTALQQFF